MKKIKLPWIKTIRRETGLVEHLCKHGVGHPALGSVQWMELNGLKGYGVHGCDGCCNTNKWKLADAQEGLRIANILLYDAYDYIKRERKKNEQRRRRKRTPAPVKRRKQAARKTG